MHKVCGIYPTTAWRGFQGFNKSSPPSCAHPQENLAVERKRAWVLWCSIVGRANKWPGLYCNHLIILSLAYLDIITPSRGQSSRWWSCLVHCLISIYIVPYRDTWYAIRIAPKSSTNDGKSASHRNQSVTNVANSGSKCAVPDFLSSTAQTLLPLYWIMQNWHLCLGNRLPSLAASQLPVSFISRSKRPLAKREWTLWLPENRKAFNIRMDACGWPMPIFHHEHVRLSSLSCPR